MAGPPREGDPHAIHAGWAACPSVRVGSLFAVACALGSWVPAAVAPRFGAGSGCRGGFLVLRRVPGFGAGSPVRGWLPGSGWVPCVGGGFLCSGRALTRPKRGSAPQTRVDGRARAVDGRAAVGRGSDVTSRGSGVTSLVRGALPCSGRVLSRTEHVSAPQTRRGRARVGCATGVRAGRQCRPDVRGGR